MTASRGWSVFGHDGEPGRLLDVGDGNLAYLCDDRLLDFDGSFPSKVRIEWLPESEEVFELSVEAPAALTLPSVETDVLDVLGEQPRFAQFTVDRIPPKVREKLGF